MLKYSTWTEITVWGQKLLNLNQTSFALRENALLTAAWGCALPARQLRKMLLQLMPPLLFKMLLFPVSSVVTTKNEVWTWFIKPMQTVGQKVLENDYFHQSSKQLLCFQSLVGELQNGGRTSSGTSPPCWNVFDFYGSLNWSQMCEVPFPFSMKQTQGLSQSPSHAVIRPGSQLRLCRALLQPCADPFSQGNGTSGETVVLPLPRIYGTGGREAGKEVSQTMSLLTSLFFSWQLSVCTSSLKGTHVRVPILAWFLLTLGLEKEVLVMLVIPTAARLFPFEIMLCSLGSKMCFSKLISPEAAGTRAPVDSMVNMDLVFFCISKFPTAQGADALPQTSQMQ